MSVNAAAADSTEGFDGHGFPNSAGFASNQFDAPFCFQQPPGGSFQFGTGVEPTDGFVSGYGA